MKYPVKQDKYDTALPTMVQDETQYSIKLYSTRVRRHRGPFMYSPNATESVMPSSGLGET